MEQLELELWAEERVTMLDQARSGALTALKHRVAPYGQADAMMFCEPTTLDVIVRYRV